MSEGELKKRMFTFPEQTKDQVKRGLESSILSGLIVNCDKTRLNLNRNFIDVEKVIADLFYEIFDNPSVKWMVLAYFKDDQKKVLDKARKEFPKCGQCDQKDCDYYYQRGNAYHICPPVRKWLLKWHGGKQP